MSRNRKSQSAAIRFAPALKAFVLCLLIGGSGVGYVWQQDQIGGLGKQIKARESRLQMLQEANEGLRRQLEMMRSPAALQRRIQELNLGLVPAQPNQVLRLTEGGLEPLRARTGEQLVAAPSQIGSTREK
jgi:hypothetical protein